MGAPKKNKPSADEVTFKLQDKSVSMSFPQAFAMAHRLYRRDRVGDSSNIFYRLAKMRPDDRPTKLMLARCLARTKQYDDCQAILNGIFEGDSAPLVSRFQDVFVSRAVGLPAAALEELFKLAKKHVDLPTVCLILGDLWEQMGQPEKAVTCWKMAARRAGKLPHLSFSGKVQIQDLQKPAPRKTAGTRKKSKPAAKPR